MEGVFLGPEPSILSTCCTCNSALGGWEVLIFAAYVPLASQSPYPIIVYSVANFIDPIFGQLCNFHNPNSVTFYFNELTHFFYSIKDTLLFICSRNILVSLLTVNMKNCLTPKNPKMCNPILVSLLRYATPL